MAALVGAFVLLLTGCFGDGTYRVGNRPGQIPPGTYSTAGAPGCEWMFAVGAVPGGTYAMGRTPSAAERQIVTIPPAATGGFDYVNSDGCGIWTQTSSRTPLSPPLADKPSGMYRVPTDMAYGYWRAPGGSGCRWERLHNFVFSHGGPLHTDGQQTVHLGTRYHGFRATGCGIWHRTGP